MSFVPILKIFKKYKTFIVATHINPDPDALASQLAIALYLKSLGKKVFAVGEDVVCARYAFLPGASMIKKIDPRKKISYDAAVVVDCGDLGRTGAVKKLLNPDCPVINIDHHITNDFFGTVNHVVPDASSTAEIIYDLFESLKFQIDKRIAVLLYLGIMTDTGSFRFENTTSRTHQVVSRLLKFNLPVNAFYQRLYETVLVSDLHGFTKLVSKFESHFNGQVVTIKLRRKLVEKFSQEFDLRDKIFHHLRTIKGVEVVAIFTEHGKNKTRVNLRSLGKVDVARLAAVYQGGGHRRASGCVVHANLEHAQQNILSDLKKIL